MDVICGRKTVGRTTGELLANGRPISKSSWSRVVSRTQLTVTRHHSAGCDGSAHNFFPPFISSSCLQRSTQPLVGHLTGYMMVAKVLIVLL